MRVGCIKLLSLQNYCQSKSEKNKIKKVNLKKTAQKYNLAKLSGFRYTYVVGRELFSGGEYKVSMPCIHEMVILYIKCKNYKVFHKFLLLNI